MTQLRVAVAATLLVLLSGCSGNRYGQPEPASEQANHTLTLWRVFVFAGAGVAAIVLGLIAYVAVRFRRRSDDVPSQKPNNVGWEVVYTITPVLVVAVLFALSVSTQSKTDRRAAQPDLVINVVGFQWGWRFEYPAQGVIVTGAGSAGESPTLVLPKGEKVRLQLRTADVIHSFWVPEFLTKRDLIPGVDNAIDVTPNRIGVYDGHCAEYCLLDHWRMTFITEVVSPDDFADRLAHAAAATHGGPP